MKIMSKRLSFFFYVFISVLIGCLFFVDSGYCQEKEGSPKFQYKQKRINKIRDTEKNRKIRVAVSRFEDKTEVKGSPFNVDEEDAKEVDDAQINISGSTVTIKTDKDKEKKIVTKKELLTGLLIDKLRKTGMFDVVERDEVNQLIREINFEKSNWVKKDNINELGNIYSVQSIVTGEILQNKDGHKIGSGLYTVSLRLYDVNTGEIVSSATASQNTLDASLEESVWILTDEMRGKPWTCKIVRIEDKLVYVNAGYADDMEKKNVFSIVRFGNEIIDPDTGKNLGREAEVVAKIRIMKVIDENLSKAEIIEENKDVVVGDVVMAKWIEAKESNGHSALWKDTFGEKSSQNTSTGMANKKNFLKKSNLSLLGVEGIVRDYDKSIVVIVSGDSMGSGFFISSEGSIITNSHVVGGNKSVTVKMIEENRVYSNVPVVKDNPIRDIALLKINEAGSFSPVILGDSDSATEGERVVALGNPEGLENTISDGLVSSIRDLNGMKVLQISVPISHGSSGGALFNMSGEVIGVTSAGLEKGQNLNFAIPINYVKEEMIN